MLEKGARYQAQIIDYTSEGQGVAKIDGCAVFIPNAIVGETYSVRIEKVGKTWASGKISAILVRSPHRVSRACPAARQCGGCAFWHMDYEEECRLKAARVQQALLRLAGEAYAGIPITPAPAQKAYRNKAQYPVGTENGRAVAGFYRAGTHQVVQTPRCCILPPEMDQVRDIVLAYMARFSAPAYDERTRTGLVRHIFVRRGAVSGQLLVCIVANGKRLPHADALIAALKAVAGFASLVLNVNTKQGNTILGETCIPLYGAGYLEDTLCGLTFRLSPHAFYQVNHDQAERLYEKAAEFAALTPQDTVLDLYCGVGTITLFLARRAGRAIGVEVVPQAVADARENARRNGIRNAEFLCGDAGAAALELEKAGVSADVIVVDPPRKGLNADAIEAIARLTPRRVVYVSCDPATLARDIALLKQRGYALKRAEAFDLIPPCAHVETVVLLSKGKIDAKKVRVEFSLEDMDLSGFQNGATYPEIKEYVLEHYGLKVSSLYIAQVKRKCCLDVGENYNLPKPGGRPQPQVTPEKEKAIREALKHFGMI